MSIKNSFVGKVDGTAYISPNSTTPISVTYAIITNIYGSTVTINLQLERQSVAHYVIPHDLQIATGDSLEFTDSRVLLPNDRLILLSSGSVDFYFSLE